MPCYDHRSSPEYVREETNREWEKEVSKLRQRNDELMRAICEIDKRIVFLYNADLSIFTTATRKLIIKHRREDAKRSK